MKFALVNGERLEAKKGLSGTCIGCEQPMISKCGPIKVKHWAHKSTCECDHWWENETEWHRAWKNNFPFDWQEIRHKAENGEWHIADVKTDRGYFIEFQHSFLKSEERQARNNFYGSNLIWVVDGLKRKNDRSYFELILKDSKQINPNFQLIQIRSLVDDYPILRDWSECKGFVFFDFGIDFPLWCFLPKSPSGHCYVLPYSRQNFVNLHNNPLNDKGYLDLVTYLNNLISAYENPQQRVQSELAIANQQVPQRQRLTYPNINSNALYNFITRFPQQANRRKFRF